MAILGLNVNTDNPSFTISDFVLYCPKFKEWAKGEDAQAQFEAMYEIANKAIFHSIYKSKWKLAMSLYIAHYLITFFSFNENDISGNLNDIGTDSMQLGVMSSHSIGEISISMDTANTMIEADENKFYNTTEYGIRFVSLRATMFLPRMFVVTPTL